MKLSELRSAIRKMKGNPSVVVELTPGVPMTLVLQKTPTLETLGLAYGDMGNADIGLTLDEVTGVISGTIGSTSVGYDFPLSGVPKAEPVDDYPDLDDEEDML